MLLLGIDLGTTNCKVCVYDFQGKYIDGFSFRAPTNFPFKGWAEYNPNEMWGNLLSGIKELILRTRTYGEIKSLSISSQSESGLLLNKVGEPLTPIIVWHDERTIEILKWWEQNISKEELYATTGLTLNFIYSLLKIQWLKENKPDVFKKAYSWMCMPDYFLYLLCGKKTIDYSTASRTMAFDIVHCNWSKSLLNMSNISEQLLSKPVPSGTALGTILPSISSESGLDRNAVVCAGGHDHMCGSLAVGMITPERIVASIGTTESVCALSFNYPKDTEKLRNSGYTIGRYVIPELYYLLGGMPSGGLTIEWAIKTLLGRKINIESYKKFITLCNQAKLGSSNLLFLPHLRGCVTPKIDPKARGAFVGLSSEHLQADLCRSVIEGLSYEFRLVLESMTGNLPVTIKAIGGGVKNKFWMQTKADILGIPIAIPKIKNATTLGAAILAGIGAGIYQSVPHALKNIQFSEELVEPNLINYNFYNEVYEQRYKNLYENLNNIAR